MSPTIRRVVGVVVVLVILGVLVAPFLDAERGVQRRWNQLVKAVEGRDQEKILGLLAADYRDQWGLDREEAAKLAHGVFRQFLRVSINREQPSLELADDGTAIARARIRVAGEGGGVAPWIARGSQQLETETVFHWRRVGRAPWDWELTRLENLGVQQDLRRVLEQIENMQADMGLPGGF